MIGLSLPDQKMLIWHTEIDLFYCLDQAIWLLDILFCAFMFLFNYIFDYKLKPYSVLTP